ncbi:MAG: serine hydrolase [Planctomycetota bacterium]|jgi:CubicO group peptidase (beta-lactamase class C family)
MTRESSGSTGSSGGLDDALGDRDFGCDPLGRLQLCHPPGEVWNYSSGTNLLLTRVISEVTGMRAGEYAKERLF